MCVWMCMGQSFTVKTATLTPKLCSGQGQAHPNPTKYLYNCSSAGLELALVPKFFSFSTFSVLQRFSLPS